MSSKWSSGKIAALIAGCLAGALLLCVAFCADVYRIYNWSNDMQQAQDEREDEEKSEELSGASKEDTSSSEEEEYTSEEDKYWEGIEYYQFTDYIREDLSYRIELEDRETESEKTYIDINYPVVLGDEVSNLEGINRAIQEELTVIENYVEKIEAQLVDGEEYEFLVDGYVTYMSEKVLSVAYVEYGYLNEEFYESYIVSVNIDMTTGMVMDNTQILEIDDDFSIDFRERCEKQNGSIEELSYFSDQDITTYLNDSKQAIILYTPLGMEVGINYYSGWVTVTYQDYADFLKQL